MTSIKKCYLIPPDELQCFWMTAGVVHYQLCDRMYDCDQCPLDAVIRGGLPRGAAAGDAETVSSSSAGSQEIPADGYRFTRNHWWAKEADAGQVRFGIESDLAQALMGVKGLVFPSLRQPLRRGQACIWVVMDGGTYPLEAPIDGVVHAINHELIDKPHLLGMHPFGDGWLCEMETGGRDVEMPDLMSAGEAQTRYAGDKARFMTSLAGSLRGKRPPVGPTLADGGKNLRNFANILGPTRYLALLRQSYGGTRRH
jgi:glycine cleavage system H protein